MNTPKETVEEVTVDAIMGIIIKNSVGMTCTDKAGDCGYANGVYLNNVKEELTKALGGVIKKS